MYSMAPKSKFEAVVQLDAAGTYGEDLTTVPFRDRVAVLPFQPIATFKLTPLPKSWSSVPWGT